MKRTENLQKNHLIKKLSIIIINWKTPKLLANCLQTLALDSSFSDFEIWVVDNNSADDSVEMLKRDFPGVRVITNPQNVGFAKACNQVIPLITSNYVLLLNPDTLCVENAVSKMVTYLDNHPNCGAVGPKVLNQCTLQLACRRSFPTVQAAFFRLTYLSRLFPKNQAFSHYNLTSANPDQELEVDALSGSCMMVRKYAIDKIGLLDEDIFMFGEDIDWCWRLKLDGWSINYFPCACVYHYHGASSRFRPIKAVINLHKGMEVFYRKHLAKQYWQPFNWMVYLAIWLRAALFIVLVASKNVVSRKKSKLFDETVAKVFANSEINKQDLQEQELKTNNSGKR